MKKIIALLLTVTFLLAMATGLVSAEETTTKTDHAKLVTHWNFEGTGDEILADKATGGTSADTLVTHGNVVIQDGIAYIPADKNTYISAVGETGDLADFSHATVLMRVRLDNDGERGGVAAFVSKQNTFEWTLEADNLSNLRARVNNEKTNAKGTVAFGAGEFRYYAMVFDYNSETGKFTATAYQSNTANPTTTADFTVVSQSTVDTVDTTQSIVASSYEFILGRRYDHLAKNRALLCWFKDIKIYSDVLSLDEILSECDGGEIDFSHFDGSAETDTEAESDTIAQTEEQTTAKPETPTAKPEQTSEKPETPTAKPENQTAKPENKTTEKSTEKQTTETAEKEKTGGCKSNAGILLPMLLAFGGAMLIKKGKQN